VQHVLAEVPQCFGRAACSQSSSQFVVDRHAPGQVVAAHLKYGADERFWPEFIMDGDAGERNGIVRLAGVSARAESLPHGQHFTGVTEEEQVPPMHRVRIRVSVIAREQGIFEREKRALSEAAQKLGVEQLQLREGDEYLFVSWLVECEVSRSPIDAAVQVRRAGAPLPSQSGLSVEGPERFIGGTEGSDCGRLVNGGPVVDAIASNSNCREGGAGGCGSEELSLASARFTARSIVSRPRVASLIAWGSEQLGNARHQDMPNRRKRQRTWPLDGRRSDRAHVGARCRRAAGARCWLWKADQGWALM
jgi:hypothetical protein